MNANFLTYKVIATFHRWSSLAFIKVRGWSPLSFNVLQPKFWFNSFYIFN